MFARLVLVALVLFVASPVTAQTFAVEARGGVAFPVDDWNDEDEIDTGWGFGANVQAMFGDYLGAYAGWERFEFGGEDDPALEADVTTTSSGFRGGVQAAVLTGDLPITPLLRVGAFYGTVESTLSDNGGALSFESDRELGFEVEGGVEVPLGDALSFTPAVLYRSQELSFDFGDSADITAAYVSLGIGLKYRFPTR